MATLSNLILFVLAGMVLVARQGVIAAPVPDPGCVDLFDWCVDQGFITGGQGIQGVVAAGTDIAIGVGAPVGAGANGLGQAIG
jgi:hypothetical protein